MPPLLTPLTKSRYELARHLSHHIVELGLSANELLVLWTTSDPQRPTAARVRRHLGMPQSTFTSLVQRLIDRGYLVTRPCRFDRRTRYLDLTIPGHVAMQIARSIQLDLEAAARPYNAKMLDDALPRHGFLASLLPWPRRSHDGLPDVTA